MCNICKLVLLDMNVNNTRFCYQVNKQFVALFGRLWWPNKTPLFIYIELRTLCLALFFGLVSRLLHVRKILSIMHNVIIIKSIKITFYHIGDRYLYHCYTSCYMVISCLQPLLLLNFRLYQE